MGIYQDKQAGKRRNDGKVRAGRCKTRAHKNDMQCKHPGKAPDVSLSLSLGITGHKRNATLENDGNSPNERTAASSETCFGGVTRVENRVVRTYSLPLLAVSQSRHRSPLHRQTRPRRDFGFFVLDNCRGQLH